MTKTIRLHASGGVETFQNTDYPTFYPPATIIGVPPQWDDGSDATYARSQTDTVSTDQRSVMAQLDPLPATYGADKVLSISAHFRFDTAHPSGETSRIYRFAIYGSLNSADSPAFSVTSTASDYPDPPDDDLIHEVDYTIYPPSGGFVDLAAVVTALHGGAWLNPQTTVRTPWQRSALTVYEAWIDVEVAADSMVRQWPNDQGGLTVTPRLYPPPRTGRIHGGHH